MPLFTQNKPQEIEVELLDESLYLLPCKIALQATMLVYSTTKTP